MSSSKKLRFLGASGLLSKSPSKNERDQLLQQHTNKNNHFEHHNPRTGSKEHFPVEKIHKFNNKKFALVGKSPTDQKSVSKIVHLKE